ncbi:DUF6668 family protein [Nesterenkonia halophila]
MNPEEEAPLWWVGVHGGAGESTMAALNPAWPAADHRWPVSPGRANRVVLVARTSLHGLTTAQKVIEQWASGEVAGVDVLGLVFVADSPGKPPKALRDLTRVIGGGVSRTWLIPWVEAWRVDPASTDNAPRPARKLLKDLSVITDENHSK